MLAEIIVDVPSLNTDQPFTYGVSENFSFVKKGCRVVVPFGKGDRLVTGFVVGLKEEDVSEELKMIQEVLDFEPVLNDELLALSQFMQEKTFAFKITCLQTMLPNALKADYDKEFWPTEQISAEEMEIFQGQECLHLKEVNERGLLNQLIKWRDQKKIEIIYRVAQKSQPKTQRYVKNLLTAAEIKTQQNLQRKNATKRLALLEALLAVKEEEVSTQFFYQLGLDASILKQGAQSSWLSFIEKEVYRDPFANKNFPQTTPQVLTDEQQVAFTKIDDARKEKQAETFLLEGITGSGKTEVYLQVIQEALNNGQTALMLVPEIALTPQMVQRFKGRFGNLVAVLHSGLGQGERYDEWRKIQRGEASVVVGARSAVFAPLENLGVIIIDEEHETSYKQSDTPRYHARDLAQFRSQFHHCPLVLGSATPSLESRARAQKKVYQLLTLTKRPTQQALPTVEIIDLKDEFKKGNFSTFSTTLTEKIQQRLKKREQIVLMLNRRGFSSFVMCRTCGFVLPCPNCDISLTLHMDIKKMKCHYCGHEEPIPNRCPQCQSEKIRYYGTGTQKVETELAELFPEARILRMDVDTTRKKGAHEKILAQFAAHEADILLGTQMIAKGLDYPLVTLVGVLNADTALHLPDFRASEHTFQLLTQVAGRAGRGDLPGEVVIQSFNPEHYAIQLAQKQDYENFYQKEMNLRHLGGYPPYFYTVQVTASHKEEDVAAKTIFNFFTLLKENLTDQAIFIGPSPKAILRVNNQFYYQLLIKYKNEPNLAELLKQIQEKTLELAFKGVKVAIDVEPLQFM
ncbi:primosomal protein N' [Enterococcus timonensis]|uniref:primosomal protein N' n=1 Tax=Enterococcus timonensis TaxID=1852364 RepID=UPI0008DAEB46|nr:primosomal protein N' [Enterococcus timonensis]